MGEDGVDGVAVAGAELARLAGGYVATGQHGGQLVPSGGQLGQEASGGVDEPGQLLVAVGQRAGEPLGALGQPPDLGVPAGERSEGHTSELQSLMRISYAVFCLKKKQTTYNITIGTIDNQAI